VQAMPGAREVGIAMGFKSAAFGTHIPLDRQGDADVRASTQSGGGGSIIGIIGIANRPMACSLSPCRTGTTGASLQTGRISYLLEPITTTGGRR
jgi:hypothetical protein